jgi:thioredoxin 1
MAPILEQLKEDFAGRMEVKFVDAWKNRQEASEYGVRMIPTQIFYAPDGSELYRHTGFFGRDDILRTWDRFGYDFGAKTN